MSAGSKVRLRPFAERDLVRMVRWNNDPEVEHFVDCDLPKTLSACVAWFTRNIPSRDYRLFALEDVDGNLIGDLELDHISWRNGEAELRIRIGEKEYWNKGYGTDAVRALLALACNHLGLRRVYLRVYRFNHRAIRCYEKCAFRKEGLLRRRANRDGLWKDIVLMAFHSEDAASAMVAAARED